MKSLIARFAHPKTDISRKLKRGEVKGLLLAEASRVCPEFCYLGYKNTMYSFQNIRPCARHNVIELIHIGFSLRGGVMSFSLASTLNPRHIHRHHLGGGLMSGYCNIVHLKWRQRPVPIEKTLYQHNGRVDGTTRTIKEMFGDFKRYGLPKLNAQYRTVETNCIVKMGLDYIDELTIDPTRLKAQVESDLNSSKGVYSLKNPDYLALKKYLQSIPDQSREDRKFIPRTAYELLELYWSTAERKTD